MIELLFVTGIVTQLMAYVAPRIMKNNSWPDWILPALICGAGVLLSLLFWWLGMIADGIAEGLLTIGMVGAVLFAIVFGFLSLELARSISPMSLMVLQGLALYLWELQPYTHRFFLWGILLPVMTFPVLLSLWGVARKGVLFRGLMTLWYYMLLIYFFIILFASLAAYFTPPPMLALTSGMLFVSLVSYGLFALKYLLMLITSRSGVRSGGGEYFQQITAQTFPTRLHLWRESILLFTFLAMTLLHLFGHISFDLYFQIVLLVVLSFQGTLSLSARKTLSFLGNLS